MDAGNEGLTFISYSRADSEFALELANELRSAGFSIWFDQLDIPPGCRWDDEVEKALTQCNIFMVILTPSSTASHNVKDEIGYAIDSNKLIMPVLLKNAVVPLRLRRFQYVDFTGKSYGEGIEAAMQLLRDLLNERSDQETVLPVEQSYGPHSPGNKKVETGHGKKEHMPARIPLITLGVLGGAICTFLGSVFLAANLLLPNSSGALATIPKEAGGPSLTETEVFFSSVEPSEEAPPQPVENTAMTIVVLPTNPLPTEGISRAYGFQACASECDGQNYSSTFPGGITKIHFLYHYENIPPGSSYMRTWDLDGYEWIRYTCNWDGPPAGTEKLRFTEPKGLHSGVWTVTIWVNNKIILQEKITVAGNWTYWDPAGTRYSCRGNN